MSIQDSYLKHCIYGSAELLGKKTMFSTLDANSCYWQAEIAKNVLEKTRYTVYHWFCRLTRMLFGLKDAPGTFQQAITVLITNVKYQFAIVYLDDIVIFCEHQMNTSVMVVKVWRYYTMPMCH